MSYRLYTLADSLYTLVVLKGKVCSKVSSDKSLSWVASTTRYSSGSARGLKPGYRAVAVCVVWHADDVLMHSGRLVVTVTVKKR